MMKEYPDKDDVSVSEGKVQGTQKGAPKVLEDAIRFLTHHQGTAAKIPKPCHGRVCIGRVVRKLMPQRCVYEAEVIRYFFESPAEIYVTEVKRDVRIISSGAPEGR